MRIRLVLSIFLFFFSGIIEADEDSKTELNSSLNSADKKSSVTKSGSLVEKENSLSPKEEALSSKSAKGGAKSESLVPKEKSSNPTGEASKGERKVTSQAEKKQALKFETGAKTGKKEKESKPSSGEKKSTKVEEKSEKESEESPKTKTLSLSSQESRQREEENKSQKPNKLEGKTKPQTPVQMKTQDKIEETFKKFLKILETHNSQSSEYKRAASFLEKTLYDEVSFDSLKVLSELYLKKGDAKGHLRIMKAVTVTYPDKAESFYLLGKAHKAFSKTIEDEEESQSNRQKMLESYQKALKLDTKHSPTYEVFLKELMILDEESQELKHTRESLSLVQDMLKYLKQKQHYVLLCEAYYDNNFIRQTQKACVKSIKKNPNEPISLMTLAFSLPQKKKREEKLLEIGSKYPNSFKTQYKIGLYFKEDSPELAINHFLKASQIQPDHLRLNTILSRLLLRNNKEKEALPYFLKTCLLSDGFFLSEFKEAMGFLRRKKKIETVIQFDKGVKKCYKAIREKKKQEKKKSKQAKIET